MRHVVVVLMFCVGALVLAAGEAWADGCYRCGAGSTNGCQQCRYGSKDTAQARRTC